MRVARGCEYRELPQLQPPHTESDEMSLTLQDAHLEFTLVHDVMMQSTMYKIWLPQVFRRNKGRKEGRIYNQKDECKKQNSESQLLGDHILE